MHGTRTKGGDRCDVLVVGAGGAGLAAAVSAAEAGARVIVLEKLAALRGTTSWSVGSFAAAQTRLQRRAGIVDSPADFAEDMAAAHPLADGEPALRDLYARESGPAVEWLEAHGVAFVGPYPEPPNRVPRMHNCVPNGRAYLDVLSQAARSLPVELRFSAKVEDLLAESGRIVGVRCLDNGQLREIAAGSVVVASGDYSASEALKRRHMGPQVVSALPINEHSSGDGHEMVSRAGGLLKRMEMVFGPQLRFQAGAEGGWLDRLPRWAWFRRLAAAIVSRSPRWLIAPVVRQLLISHMSPAPAFFEAGARLVDAQGNDLGDGADAVNRLALTGDRHGYVIGSQALARRFSRFPDFVSTAPGVAFAYFDDYERARPDLVTWADGPAALAARLGIPAGRLEASCPDLRDERVFALGPVFAMLTVTEGGAAIDTQCRVLGKDGTPIAGLYAAGGAGQGGLILKGHGLHIGWSITSGRIAGREAARAALRGRPAAGQSAAA